MNNIQHVSEFLSDCPVIDTHEHLDNEPHQPALNLLHDYTRHYFNCDLISAGLNPTTLTQLTRHDLNIREKWMLLQPYWDLCRHTGYGRMLDLSARALYGVESLCLDTIEQAERSFQALRAQPGYGEQILRTQHIEHVMNNTWRLDGDDLGGLFWFMTQIDRWIMFDRDLLNPLPASDISDVDDWATHCLQVLKADFSQRNAKALKMAIAYQRCLSFENVSHTDAQASFLPFRDGGQPGKAAQDYVLHRILEWANETGLILQIHTGYPEGNANDIRITDPAPLSPLFVMYPQVRFDLFHIGYPYHHFTGALGKMHPNVRLDMCWAHILCPGVAQNVLYEWLSLMPLNKIFAFGGDCLFFDGVIGHLQLAKHNVASALGRCVDDGLFSIARAEQVARMLFYDNPKSFYGM